MRGCVPDTIACFPRPARPQPNRAEALTDPDFLRPTDYPRLTRWRSNLERTVFRIIALCHDFPGRHLARGKCCSRDERYPSGKTVSLSRRLWGRSRAVILPGVMPPPRTFQCPAKCDGRITTSDRYDALIMRSLTCPSPTMRTCARRWACHRDGFKRFSARAFCQKVSYDRKVSAIVRHFFE